MHGAHSPVVSGKIGGVRSEELKAESERLQRGCDFAAERQVAAAGFWTNIQLFLGATAAGLAAFASGSAFSDQNVLAGILAAAAALAAAVLASLRPGERAAAHQRAARSYHALGVDIRIFRDFDAKPTNGRREVDVLRKLLSRSAALDASSPWVRRPWDASPGTPAHLVRAVTRQVEERRAGATVTYQRP